MITPLWPSLPSGIVELIYRKAREKNLSQVDTKLKQISARITKTLVISPPSVNIEQDEHDILIRLVKRYTQIKSLWIGDKNREFDENEQKHLFTFIQYLKTNPLDHVEKLVIYEIKSSGTFESKAINRLFMGALGHPNLKSIFIHVHYEPSVLTGEEIQPILVESVNLRKFKLNCHSVEHPSITLIFDKQVKLRSAHLIEFCETPDTLQSIRSCKKLRSLRLDHAHDPGGIKQMLSETSSTSLNRLCLPGILIGSDSELSAITKAHPNLKYLHIALGEVTEQGIAAISQNCPELNTLYITYNGASKPKFLEGVIRYLASTLEHLKLFRISPITGISDETKKMLTKEFPHFR